MSGWQEWLWVGLVSLPFAILGNLIYDQLIKNTPSKIGRLAQPLSETEHGILYQFGVIVVVLYFSFFAFEKQYAESSGIFAFMVFFIFFLFVLYLLALIVAFPFFIAFQRRADLILYSTVVIFLSVLFLKKSGLHVFLQFLILLYLAACVLALMQVVIFLVGAAYKWLTRDP